MKRRTGHYILHVLQSTHIQRHNFSTGPIDPFGFTDCCPKPRTKLDISAQKRNIAAGNKCTKTMKIFKYENISDEQSPNSHHRENGSKHQRPRDL